MQTTPQAKFQVGQPVVHLKFGYRGVVFDVDPFFSESDEWYEEMAKSRPPKDRPWYRVLVDGESHTTYVAERHLAADGSDKPIRHPWIDLLFSGIEKGYYVPRITKN